MFSFTGGKSQTEGKVGGWDGEGGGVGRGLLLQRGKDEEGVIGVCVCVRGVEKASCSFLTKKKKSILCRELGLLLSPPTAPPPLRIMSSPRRCHIDYADRKLPLFVPSALPSVIPPHSSR